MFAIRDAYRFALKTIALLVPAEVATVTLAAPTDALAGTLHLICVSLQEMYFVHALLANFTELMPCDAPRPAPVMVTRAPRLPEAGVSFLILGAGGGGGVTPPFLVARMTPPEPTAQPCVASMKVTGLNPRCSPRSACPR